MTIAIGFFCDEGIVLGADSRETISGYTKEYKGKIITCIYEDFVIAFAGAGASEYIATAIEKATDGLAQCKNMTEIREGLEKRFMGFFNEHLTRWACFPQNERPDVELLVGVSVTDGEHELFHYHGTAFHRTSQQAIGAGVILANNLMSNYCWDAKTVDELSSLAVYVLWKVKKQVDSCGGFTDLVAMKEGGYVSLTDWRDVQKLETELENEENETIADLKKAIILKKLPASNWLRNERAGKPKQTDSSTES